MEVCCKVYGLANTSWGVECALERNLLTVGTCIQYNDRFYTIVSIVESQGHWCANVVPANQRRTLRRPLLRRQDETDHDVLPEEWRQRFLQAERQWHMLQGEYAQMGERLDRLMAMLEHVTKEPGAHQHEQSRSVQRPEGREHVR